MPTTVVGEDSTLLLEVQETELLTSETMSDKLIWSGKFSSNDRVTRNGEHCMCISPEILLNPPSGMSMYSFDKQFVLDMGVQMNEAPASSNTEITKKCYVCTSRFPPEKMRVHVAKHILMTDITESNVFGYCGRSSCTNLEENAIYL